MSESFLMHQNLRQFSIKTVSINEKIIQFVFLRKIPPNTIFELKLHLKTQFLKYVAIQILINIHKIIYSQIGDLYS
jgi:hypothetical protein